MKIKDILNEVKINPLKSNMTELHLGDKTILFSYSTPVAAHVEGEGYYKTNKKFSVTTTKHINQWLDGAHAKSVDQEDIEAMADHKTP